jgi:TolA-binding protein
MKILALLVFMTIPAWVFCQGNYNVTDPDKDYKEAKEYFIKGQYSLAYPLLKEVAKKYPENTQSSHTDINEDIEYYYIVCQLVLNQPVAEDAAKRFITNNKNEGRQQVMSYHLAHYYFGKEDFANAIPYFEKAKYKNLSNDEIATAKFELAYSYFNQNNLEKAKPLFNEIHQLPGNKYYYAANYYYGFISYYDKDFVEALRSFKIVEKLPEYKNIVPYYIAQLYYFTGDKTQALSYGEAALANPQLYYKKDLGLLVGQLYFDLKEFAKARPYLEAYVNNTDKVSREVMYELSYTYFDANMVDKAIEGFKQLSNSNDSLGQNSMYLLGDLYLKTGQKVNARNAFQFSAGNSSNKQQQEISKFNYAKLSYELGYQDIAINEMKKFVNQYPNSSYITEAKEILVRLLANTNNFTDALSLYESLGKSTPAMQKLYPRILYGKATEFLNDQQFDKADALFSKVVTDPNSGKMVPYANFWRGEIAYRQNRYDDAIKSMDAYLLSLGTQGDANPQTARYVMGYSYLKKENYKLALQYFQLVAPYISKESSSIEQDAYVRTADSYFMLKDYKTAKTMYDNVINNALSQSDYAIYQKAMIAGISSSAEKIKTLNTLIKQYPSSDLIPDANLEIANTYMADEKFKDAIPYLTAILATNANGLKPSAYLKLALSYYNLDNNTEALNNYKKLLELYPQSTEADQALENMKSIYVEEGKPNEYVDILKKAGRSVSVSQADSLTYNAAELKYNKGDCVTAIKAFTDYLSQYPDGAFAVQANFFKSECYVKAKDYKNAIEGYEYVANKGGNKYAERSALQAARIYYVELQDYAKAKTYFTQLNTIASTEEIRLEALRGLVRSYYQTKDYTEANNTAKELLTKKGISTDDKAIANLVLGKSLQAANDCEKAIAAFKAVAAVNKSAWGAEARYEIANCQFKLNNFSASEKAAMEVTKVTGSYDYWVTKAYILLGDIYMQQKDYFNAKATYQSVANNSTIAELKAEAQQKLDKATEQEKAGSKIN